MKKKSKKKEKIPYMPDFIEPTEEDKYRKYKRRNNMLSSMVGSIMSLAIGTMAMGIAMESWKAAGVFETKSHSRVGKLNSVTVSGGN